MKIFNAFHYGLRLYRSTGIMTLEDLTDDELISYIHAVKLINLALLAGERNLIVPESWRVRYLLSVLYLSVGWIVSEASGLEWKWQFLTKGSK